MRAPDRPGRDRTRQSLVGVFLAGCLLFGYPALALFNFPVSIAGAPLLYVYLFGAWAVLIALIAFVLRR